MRAVAVAGVVAFHANPGLAPGGFSGVDIFFVISGYLISRLVVDALAAGMFRFAGFYARRLVRLVPALAVVLFACWTFGWFTLLPAEYAQLGTHLAAGAGFVANIVFWTETGYFDTDAASKPLLHLWSLGVEEQFYLLWPLLLALAWWVRARLLFVMLGVAAVSLAVNIATVGAHPAAAFYLPASRLWELALGGALACLSWRDHADARLALPRWIGRTAAALPRWLPSAASGGALVLLVASLTMLGGRPFPGWWALLPVGWALVTIAAGPGAWVNRVVLSHRALTFVGAISYPLYLWHWPLLTFARVVTVGELGSLATAGLVTVAGLLAALTYRFVERPAQAAYRAGRMAWLPAQLVTALVVVAAAGLSVRVWSRELPPRFPASVQALVDFQYDYATAYRERVCYLMADQPGTAFGTDCVDERAGPTAPLLVLWGDSHAAHLYPGLRRLQRDVRFRLAQFTAGACPPLRSLDVPLHPSCREINERVLDHIATLRPQVVLLAARWDVYRQSTLDDTVAALRRVSRARIVLLGQLPNWPERVPRVLFNEARQRRFSVVPDRLPYFDGNYDRADRGLREHAERLGVEFVSGYGTLCNAEGCLVKMGGAAGGLTTWDDHHLTSEGSAIVVRALAPRLFGGVRAGGAAAAGPRGPATSR
jgi:peptidoglycan/LPS O-acetylase OafA/YrhL